MEEKHAHIYKNKIFLFSLKKNEKDERNDSSLEDRFHVAQLRGIQIHSFPTVKRKG